MAIYDPRDFNWTKSPCPKDVPCQISKHSGQWFMRRRFLLTFSLFCPLLGSKRGQLLYLNKTESPSMFPHQIWLKLAMWFVRRSFLSFCYMYISLYKNMSPLGFGHLWPQGVYLNKVKSPCPKYVPSQISMHSGQWFMRRRFFKIYQHFPYFAPYWAPKVANPFIWTNLNPHPPSIPPSLVEIGQVVHEKKIFKGFCSVRLYKNMSP